MSTPLKNNWDLVLSGLLRCIYNTSFLDRYGTFIKPKYIFEGDSDVKVLALRKLFELILEIYRTRRHTQLLGSLDSFEQEVRKLSDGEIHDECLAILSRFDAENGDQKIIRMAKSEQCEVQFLDTLKMMTIREWTHSFSDPWKKGQMTEAQQSVEELTSKLKLLNKRDYEVLDSGSMYSFLENMNQQSYRNFRIGIPKLDQENGWIEPQTLNLFAAPPGRGKSMMANTIIRLSIMQSKHIHITIVENRKENFVPRLIAALAGISIHDLKNRFGSLSSEMQRRVRVAAEKVEKYVTVSFMYGQGIEAVHSMKVELMNQRLLEGKPKFDIDIVDYTGHIVHYSGNSTDAMHTKFRNAYAMRKDFALQKDLICFDFVQINREGTKKTDFGASKTGMGDLATSFDLAQVCDTLITINQAEFDRQQEEAKLYIAKGREGGLGEEIVVKTLFKYGRFAMNYDSADPDKLVKEGLDEEIIGKAAASGDAPVTPDNVTPFPKGGKP